MHGSAPAPSTAIRAGTRRRLATSAARVRFQPTADAKPTSTASGIVSGRNTELKYGGPTDTLPRFSASITSGSSVPSSTPAAAPTRNPLLSHQNPTRQNSTQTPPHTTLQPPHPFKLDRATIKKRES